MREVTMMSTSQCGKGLVQEGAIEEGRPGDEKIAPSSKWTNNRGAAISDSRRAGEIGRSVGLEGDGLKRGSLVA